MVIVIGIIAGIVAGLGQGGGTVLIVCLTIFLGVEQRVAQSVNLLFFIPTAITSIILNSKRKLIRWSIAIPVILASVVSAGIGASLANIIDISLLRRLFGVFLGVIAIYEVYTLFNKK